MIQFISNDTSFSKDELILARRNNVNVNSSLKYDLSYFTKERLGILDYYTNSLSTKLGYS